MTDEPDWALPAGWLDEAERERHHAVNLRLEAAEYAKRYWQGRATGDLTPAECEALNCSRWSCIAAAAKIERALRGLA